MDERTIRLKEIEKEILELTISPLYEERIKNNAFAVIGEGSHSAPIMLIGEAPGKNEAMTGKPFCGASGKILDELLLAAHINRNQVYITNIVKDRPPQNRDPSLREIEIYAPFLDRQIEIIKPRIIATLGRFSMCYIMTKFGLDNELLSISQIHGKEFRARTNYGDIKIIPLYHPAVAIYNRSKLIELKSDFQKLSEFL